MENPVCKMCGVQSGFVKAHIVPQSFYPERDRGKDALSVLSSHPNDRKRHSRTGIYDMQLVCAKCEQLFDPLDNYASKLLVEGARAFRTTNYLGQPLVYHVDSFDYVKLKLFCLSLLWRTAASGRREFANVDLGSFLPTLTNMVKHGDPGNADTFATILCKFSGIESWQSGVITPVRQCFEGINFYSIVATAYVFHIKVDHRPVRDPLAGLVIRPDAPLLILAQDFRDSAEFDTMLRLVKRVSEPRDYSGTRG
jgi:hypothetical protein